VTRQPVTQVKARGSKQATLSSNINVSGDKASLMAAAGISPSDYAYADFIIAKESGWRPGALNGGSGAYGLCQSLPASKMASAGADYLTNPVTQLKWCSGYTSRYGGWQGAYNAWLAQGWW
jgi:soluble lytic murein transglycosylase-like protein